MKKIAGKTWYPTLLLAALAFILFGGVNAYANLSGATEALQTWFCWVQLLVAALIALGLFAFGGFCLFLVALDWKERTQLLVAEEIRAQTVIAIPTAIPRRSI